MKLDALLLVDCRHVAVDAIGLGGHRADDVARLSLVVALDAIIDLAAHLVGAMVADVRGMTRRTSQALF